MCLEQGEDTVCNIGLGYLYKLFDYKGMPFWSNIKAYSFTVLTGLRRWIEYSSSSATDINYAQFNGKSHLTDILTIYTSSLLYICRIYVKIFYC